LGLNLGTSVLKTRKFEESANYLLLGAREE
jgi:hypothetical protein